MDDFTQLPNTEQLRRLAVQWAHDDCDAATAELALNMAQTGEADELIEHFAGDLNFGTAGLRAKVGPGPLCMNAATVRKASLAVARYLTEQAIRPLVIVAFDARLSSRMLAEQCVGVLAERGLRVRYFAEPTPTPLAAFALRYLSANAAVVITASHNPKEYNGMKVYGADGVQIGAPTDTIVARLMRSTGPAREIACRTGGLMEASSDVSPIAPEVSEAYFSQVTRMAVPGIKQLRIAYTPLHGVGAEALLRVLKDAGYLDVRCVAEQVTPDGSFPTVAFPNPEEPGVMHKVFALAETSGAHLAIANDPDADRLAVGVCGSERSFSMLSGNQVGMLLADYLLARYQGNERPLVVQSIVSSPMLAVLAESYGARCERTLTGFKWIMRAAHELQPQYRFLLGYEEALGYALFDGVRDKDGISAALVFAELAERARANGESVPDVLFRIYRAHGLWVSRPLNVVRSGSNGAKEIRAAMNRVRTAPPAHLADLPVTAVTDYQQDAVSRASWLGQAELIELQLGYHGRVLARPSGTEPKLKFYVDLRGDAPESQQKLRSAEVDLEQLATRVAQELSAYALDASASNA